MRLIAHNQLQGMLPWRQLDCNLCLATTKVLVMIISGQRFVRCRRLGYINKQVMMPCIVSIHPGGRNAHTL